ncbi:MAG: hypothetical protein WCD07_04025 [Burkholderiales bacterium]
MNKIKLFKQVLAMSAVLAASVVSMESQAVSMYARQTGMACASCHFQHYPLLNDFGRAFKASGYTLVGPQGVIKGEDLSIPASMNVGIVSKLRYQKSNGPKVTGTHAENDGRWDIPDEFNVLLGGRISENIGFFFEGGTVEGPFLAGFKMPFVYDVDGVKLGVIPFSTGELGASFGFELLNTGAVKNQRMVEKGVDISAQQYITDAHQARGVTLMAYDPLYFANVTKWSPGHVEDHMSTPTANYFRAAFTPKVAGWDLGAGVQYWSGSAEVGPSGAVVPNDVKAWAVDAQAQGVIESMPLGIYISYAKAAATGATGNPNFFNSTPGNNERKAAAISAELGILPRKATVILAYRRANNGELDFSGDNALTIGATYQLAQNMQLQLTHATRSGSAYNAGSPNMTTGNGDRLTTFVLFGSF